MIRRCYPCRYLHGVDSTAGAKAMGHVKLEEFGDKEKASLVWAEEIKQGRLRRQDV